MLTFDRNDLAELNRKLQELTGKEAKKAMRAAARKGMKPVRDAVKANAPEDLEDDDGVKIKASVGMTSKWKGDTLYTKVGIRGGAKKNPDTPYYFRMVEFGTKNMPARPFMTPALESNAQEVIDTITEALRKALFQ